MTTEIPPLLAVPVVYGENDAAVLETFVVPSYLRLFWEASRQVLLVGEAARVAHLGSRTGYPDAEILQTMPNTVLVSVEESLACHELARSKFGRQEIVYHHAHPLASGLADDAYSHALALAPVCDDMTRVRLLEEMQRVLYPGGQAILAVPLSRSFPEILDLMSEFALKHDVTELGRALEDAAAERVTIETLSDDLENAGLSDVDFVVHQDTLSFDSGRALLEDPAMRYLVYPQIAHWLDGADIRPALDYVSRAIDKYWSEGRMEVSVVIAAMSARR